MGGSMIRGKRLRNARRAGMLLALLAVLGCGSQNPDDPEPI